MAYTTQPGTVAHRAVAHMRAHGNREWSTAELADLLEVDPTGFSTFLFQARHHGLVKARTIPGKGKILWWSLGDGTPAPLPPDDDGEGRPVQRVVAFSAEPSTDALPATPAPSPAPTPEPEPASAPEQDEEPPAQRLPFNACRYLDGSVVVVGVEVRDDGAVVFNRSQMRKLMELHEAAR